MDYIVVKCRYSPLFCNKSKRNSMHLSINQNLLLEFSLVYFLKPSDFHL